MKQSAKKLPKRSAPTGHKTKNIKKILKKAGNAMGDMQKFVELLQINQIELEHQNEELRLSEMELEASRNKYVNLFDFSPIPYFGLDPKGIIKSVNISGAKMLSVDRSRLIEKSFQTYVPREERDTFESFIETVFKANSKQSCKLKVVNKEKKVYYVLVEAIVLDSSLETGRRCEIALIDLTEYRKLEEAFEKVSQELTLLKADRKKS